MDLRPAVFGAAFAAAVSADVVARWYRSAAGFFRARLWGAAFIGSSRVRLARTLSRVRLAWRSVAACWAR